MQKQFEEHAYVKIKTETHDKVTCFSFWYVRRIFLRLTFKFSCKWFTVTTCKIAFYESITYKVPHTGDGGRVTPTVLSWAVHK